MLIRADVSAGPGRAAAALSDQQNEQNQVGLELLLGIAIAYSALLIGAITGACAVIGVVASTLPALGSRRPRREAQSTAQKRRSNGPWLEPVPAMRVVVAQTAERAHQGQAETLVRAVTKATGEAASFDVMPRLSRTAGLRPRTKPLVLFRTSRLRPAIGAA